MALISCFRNEIWNLLSWYIWFSFLSAGFWSMSLVFTKETFLINKWTYLRIMLTRTSKTLWILALVLVGILESIFETDSAADFDSFYIIADCLIADSSDKEMSIAFCSVRLAPSLSRCCCVRSWFTQQTKRSRNILSNESSYSQYWLNLLNSAIHWLVIYPMPGNNATLRINFTDLRKWNFVRSLFETVLHKWYTCYE